MAQTDILFVTSFGRDPVAVVGIEADRIVVRLGGELDVGNAADLSEAMARAIALGEADVVVDLSGVQFIDAATVRIIVRAGEFLRQRSRSIALRSPAPCARRILELCDLAHQAGPSPADTGRTSGSPEALGKLVAVPTADRVDRPTSPHGDAKVSSAGRRAHEPISTVAVRGGT